MPEQRSEAPRPGTTKRLRSVAEGAREHRRKVYEAAIRAREEGKKLAWNMYAAYIEPLLEAFDIEVVGTENYGAICAAKRAQRPFLEAAERDGYPLECCGYTRVGLGYSSLYLELGHPPPDAPQGGMGRPDIFITNSLNCDTRMKFPQAVQRYWNIPCYCIDIPVTPPDTDYREVKEYYLPYLVEQYRGLVRFLEEQTGRKLDYDRLWYHLDLQNRALAAYAEIYRLRQVVPTPIGATDMFPLAGPIMFYGAKEITLDLLLAARDELQERVRQGLAAVPGEKFRLIWGMSPPPWYMLPLFEYMESLGAVFIGELSYWLGEASDIVTQDPVETLALREWERYNERGFTNSGVHFLKKYIPERWITEGRADGMVANIVPSCRDALADTCYWEAACRKTGRDLPLLFIEADVVDDQAFSESETKARISSFLGTIAARRPA